MTSSRVLSGTLLATLFALINAGFAQPKVIEGYDALEIAAGQPG